MRLAYSVRSCVDDQPVPVSIRAATESDYAETEREGWQTSWLSDFIGQDALDKYALKIAETGELVGLGAYRNMPDSMLVFVEYIESAPVCNPTLTGKRKYTGIGAVLLAFAIQLSIDYGYGGTICLKAKTTTIREHYIKAFGAIPFSRYDPYLLFIDGDAAKALFSYFLEEE